MAEKGDLEVLRPEGHDGSGIELAQVVGMPLPGDSGQRPGTLGDRRRDDGIELSLPGLGDCGLEIVE